MMRSIRFRRGATIIEFALVAFIFFLVMFGILEFGRAFYVRNTTQHITRCIAREAVVLKPSDFEEAKTACLFNSGKKYLWPFFELSADDMTGLFSIEYCMKDGNPSSCVTEPTNSNWDNQSSLCQNTPDHCITTVQVCLQKGYMLKEFGILRGIMGITGQIEEPEACTTMPAEAMGAGR